ncbi:hypothetical protein OXPF_41550 [Oxobacter pfennigii]|uniref:Uncharacterized protein n=1 Tax=Oxobacter pfennigii TaxID=36849 RepID=A0A0P8W1P0_9CLOT|nr:hypothetical protein [Oxobacter pfennigii]KPU42370.1 hypothetical protein OXPF_41550 [Oxobacter pfennigii]
MADCNQCKFFKKDERICEFNNYKHLINLMNKTRYSAEVPCMVKLIWNID